MTSLRFDPGSTSKTLNLFLLRFNERSGFQNLDNDEVLTLEFEKRDGQIRTNEIKNKYKNKKNKKTKNWQSKSKACESNVCSG